MSLRITGLVHLMMLTVPSALYNNDINMDWAILSQRGKIHAAKQKKRNNINKQMSLINIIIRIRVNTR